MGILCPSCHPATSVKALKTTQSTDPNQWPGLMLSLSTTGAILTTSTSLAPTTNILTEPLESGS